MNFKIFTVLFLAIKAFPGYMSRPCRGCKTEVISQRECGKLSRQMFLEAFQQSPESVFLVETPYKECANFHRFILKKIVEENWNTHYRHLLR
ncbi:Oidioi.mRNA.OKI2018_I69.chr2.g4031.t1.cds [Oikopleura dioica]|uniref:Oidioi.mRNA.OKI2018_I69.chr2.g4031.t1.cds n=1 Tax=Oikopleura dioica TaxID=34765 RepID=A0ABN7SW16_OIKDI|nr:Oidioi.mRNA.OKI2018_I69.chr2.g4031.t1.cds [Oikopleura dioica]